MLKLIDSKTEFIIFGTSASFEKVKTKSVGNITISPVNGVRNIGAMFDREMKMEVHGISSTILVKFVNTSTTDQTKVVIHAYVTSKLDFNSALLYNTSSPKYIRKKLQLVQNATANVITGNKKHDHMTQILYDLHWLPTARNLNCLKIPRHIARPMETGLLVQQD